MEWNELTRLSQDVCSQTLEEKQSQLSGLYHVATPGYRWCESAKSYGYLMSEPAHYYKVYRSGCNVDRETDLQHSNLTNYRYKNQLFARPYLGAFMGAGQRGMEKDLESQLIYGSDTRIKKAMNTLSEASIDRFESLPEYGNPQRVQHVVEPWIRGGDATRDYVRRINYEKHCQNKKNNSIVNTGFNSSFNTRH